MAGDKIAAVGERATIDHEMRAIVIVVVVAACGGRQSGGVAEDRCAKPPAGTAVPFQVEMGTAGEITDGESVAPDGSRRWGMTFNESSDGTVAYVVESATEIRIGYTRNSWCGGAPRPPLAIAVKVPAGKPVVAEQCGGHSSCEPNVP
jgi:hypothetical protein